MALEDSISTLASIVLIAVALFLLYKIIMRKQKKYTKLCSTCGIKNDIDAKLCSNCGYEFVVIANNNL